MLFCTQGSLGLRVLPQGCCLQRGAWECISDTCFPHLPQAAAHAAPWGCAKRAQGCTPKGASDTVQLLCLMWGRACSQCQWRNVGQPAFLYNSDLISSIPFLRKYVNGNKGCRHYSDSVFFSVHLEQGFCAIQGWCRRLMRTIETWLLEQSIRPQ